MTIISRLGFCAICAKENRPHTGQLFLVKGSSSGEYKCLQSTRNGKRGLVPHLYLLLTVKGSKAYYQTCCSMNKCGTLLVEDDDETYLTECNNSWSTVLTMKLSDWNALVLFKDTGEKI